MKRIEAQHAYIRAMMEKHPDLREHYQEKLDFKDDISDKTSSKERVSKAFDSCDVILAEIESLLGKVKASEYEEFQILLFWQRITDELKEKSD